jgi:regulator of sirC expression with transglutaminase-like and TPR domain
MAADLSQTIGPNDSPEAIITKLNLYIFTRLQMIPQPDNNGMEFTCLTGILDNKKSSCLGLTGLYLVLAEKLDLPLYGVLLPGHSFVRYQNGPTERNIETLRNGIERSDQFYKEYFNVQNPGDTYLRNLNNDELLALYNFNLGNACRERGLFEDAERKYRQATRLFPEFKEARDNLQNLSTKVQRDKGT